MQKQGLRRRKKVLKAAAKLFASKTFHGTTIEDIASEAGMLKGSLYYYFKTKEEILWAIAEKTAEWSTKRLNKIASSRRRPADKLKQVIEFIIGLYTGDSPYYYESVILIRDTYGEIIPTLGGAHGPNGPSYSEIHGRYTEQVYRLWKGIISEGIEKGEFRSDLDTAAVVQLTLGMCNSLPQWYRSGRGMTPDGIKKNGLSLVMDSILPRGSIDGNRKRVKTVRQRDIPVQQGMPVSQTVRKSRILGEIN